MLCNWQIKLKESEDNVTLGVECRNVLMFYDKDDINGEFWAWWIHEKVFFQLVTHYRRLECETFLSLLMTRSSRPFWNILMWLVAISIFSGGQNLRFVSILVFVGKQIFKKSDVFTTIWILTGSHLQFFLRSWPIILGQNCSLNGLGWCLRVGERAIKTSFKDLEILLASCCVGFF